MGPVSPEPIEIASQNSLEPNRAAPIPFTMNVNTLLEKLEPLIPDEVRQWRRSLVYVDEETRKLLERHIRVIAERMLGDLDARLLLPPPSEGTARSTFHLGTVLYEKDKWPVGLSASEIMQNVAIFGRSGAGKTNVVFHLIQQLTEKKVAWLHLDWKRNGRDLLPHLGKTVRVVTPGRPLAPFPFNPFIPPPGLEPNVYLQQVVDILSDAYTLGDGSRSLIEKAIRTCYVKSNAPDLGDVIAAVNEVAATDRVRGWKISALRALETLRMADLGPKDPTGQVDVIHALLGGQTIVELNGLSQASKRFLIPLIALWVYYVRLGAPDREQLRLVIILEEAHHVLRHDARRETVMTMLLRQCRELGIGIIVVDQHPHLISPAALGNTYATICLNLKDPRDVKRAGELCLLNEHDRRFLSLLPVGEGVVKLQDRYRHPFHVRFPLVRLQKGAVTDEALKRFLYWSKTDSGRKRFLEQEYQQIRQVRAGDSPLDEEHIRFVEDVVAHEDDGVRRRYARLGLSADRGNRIKNELVDAGILDAQDVPVGQTRKVLLRLSPVGRDRFGLDRVPGPGRGSIVHEYWKRFHERAFAARGYRVRLEAPRIRTDGRMDLLAIRDRERIALEVETGESDVVSNVRRDLRERVDRVVVVATTGPARTKIERALARAGLLVPNRIEIVVGAGPSQADQRQSKLPGREF